MNLLEDREEVSIGKTEWTIMLFVIEYIEHNSVARGSISVSYEGVRQLIINPWVANIVNGQWVVSRVKDGRQSFFDLVTFQPAFTPYHDVDEIIRLYIAEKLKVAIDGCLASPGKPAPLPHEVVHAQGVWCNPT